MLLSGIGIGSYHCASLLGRLTATAAGYGAFILGPLTIGLLAQATSLRLALGLLVLTSLGIAGLATRGQSR